MSAFQDRVAIVTGGASGIGLAVVQELAQRGAQVVIADVDGAKADAAAAAIVASGGRARAARVDVADAVQVEELIAGTYASDGRLDYLFNNAGIALFGEVRDMTLAQWKRLLEVNLHGVVHGIAAAYPRMVERGTGHIVNTASLAGLVPTPGAAAYATTKHAVVGLSTSLRGEGAALGVKVSAVCPGLIDTPIKHSLTWLHLDKEKMLADPLFRLCPADVCARVILRGVERNRAIITVTAGAVASWWLYRFFPRFVTGRLGSFVAGQMRVRFGSRPS
ncbi:MAG: SDR family oxidoreductase [bacterium]